MTEVVFRASSIGRLMTEPKTKSEGALSVGAKTYVREIAPQSIFGIEFEVTSKEMEKGLLVEADALAMVNRVRGLSLVKNTERRTVRGLTGEPDAIDFVRGVGHDIKSSWSAKTYRAFQVDCVEKLYEWQCRAYMALWNVNEYEVNYCLVDTPEALIGFEPMQMHLVSHIPEHMRVTTWTVTRDRAIEDAMFEKVTHARAYFNQVIREFDESHPNYLKKD